MKKILSIASIVLLLLLLTWHQSTISALLGFFVTGHIPGTQWSVPFWGMMALYCLLITALVTRYVEEMLTFRRTAKATYSRKSRMPRRRFGHI